MSGELFRGKGVFSFPLTLVKGQTRGFWKAPIDKLDCNRYYINKVTLDSSKLSSPSEGSLLLSEHVEDDQRCHVHDLVDHFLNCRNVKKHQFCIRGAVHAEISPFFKNSL